MRPTDPRLRAQLGPARSPLLAVVCTGVLGSLALIAQAFAVTALVLAIIHTDPVGAVVGRAVLVAALFALRGLLGWIGDVAAARAAGSVGAGLRRRVLGALLAPDGRRDDAGGPGRNSVLATRGVAAAEPYLTRYVPALVLAGVLPVLTLIVIAVMDPLSGLIVVCTLPLIPLFGALVGLATRDRAATQWRAMELLSGHFLDVMRGLPTLVAFRRAEAQSRTIAAVTERYRVASLATLRIAFASAAILEMVATISVALVAVTVGIRLAGGHMDLRTALVVLLLAPEAYWPLRRAGSEFHAAAEGVATFEAVDALGDPRGSSSGRVGTRFAAEEVSLTYPGRTVPALAPISLDLAGPGVTAVVGPSGCGKSTLLRILAGQLDPSSGEVVAPPREQVAYLPQRPVFVASSIGDNLRLARPDATDEELWAALADVALAERVGGLLGGLEADLAEDGRSLSAGERARLALARVGLSGRPYVLLDEPTAHLDSETEQVIADTVIRWGGTRTVIVVAHRTALVAAASRVVELAAPAAIQMRTTASASDRARPFRAPIKTSTTAAGEADRARPYRAPRKTSTTAAGDGDRAHPYRAPIKTSTTAATADRAHPYSDPAARPIRGGWGAALLGGLASASGVALTALAGWLIVRADARPAILTLTVAMVGVRTFGLARPVLRYVERLWSHDRALRLLAQRRVEVYDALVPLVPGRIGRRGDVLASVVDDVDAVLDTELRVRLPVRAYVVVATLAVLVAALIRPVAGAVILADALLAWAVFALARRGASRAEERAVTARAALSDAVVEAAQTADELRTWGAEQRAYDAVAARGAELAAATRSAATWLGGARALVLTAAGAAVAALALLLRAQVAGGDLTGPVLALLLLLPIALAEATTSMADAGAAAARGAAASDRLDALAAEPPAITETATPRPAPDGSTITTEGAHARRRTLPDLTLEPGERVAVVGPSGSGKSTLAALLLRFLDPDRGRIGLDDADYRDLAAAAVRERVGLVDDDPHVFASSVVENVRLARPESTDEEVEQALRHAHLGRWLDDLPRGLHTHLGASTISGGERARLAIARSLLADQPVLVLDEPTAHLDAGTAAEVAGEILDARERSIVWITHSDVGLDRVDRVITTQAD